MELFDGIDSYSFFAGIVMCMLMDVVFAVISYFLEKGFNEMKKRKGDKNASNGS